LIFLYDDRAYKIVKGRHSLFEHISAKYKKSWLINMRIARDLIGFTAGDRLPTIEEFSQNHVSSRGIVQKALERLQSEGAVTLEKRGKMGTYIGGINQKTLFRLGGLEYIIATMPPAITGNLAGLATGICDAMEHCPVSFNFAFIHGSDNRAAALSRAAYDFAVTSRAAAKQITARYPNLEIMMLLEGCVYSPPFVLCSRRPGAGGVSDGDTIAADPTSTDQYFLTKQICRGKKVKIIESPYVTCRALFLAGEIDFIVYRNESWIRQHKISTHPLTYSRKEDYLLPAVLINKQNYNIGNILKTFLESPFIAESQTAVMEHRREMRIY
jgi:hypothetical protein